MFSKVSAMIRATVCRAPLLLVLLFPTFLARAADDRGLLFYVSGDKGTTAGFSAGGTPEPNFDFEVTRIPDGAKGAALQCGDHQRLAWWAPGNIYAQRGTLSFFWRSRYPVGPTEFPIFRVGYADHSSWDMLFLRMDYNGHGFDAFVTDASLSRTRVSVTVQPFPKPDEWTHLALAWDETRGIRFYVNGKLAATNETRAVYNAAVKPAGPEPMITTFSFCITYESPFDDSNSPDCSARSIQSNASNSSRQSLQQSRCACTAGSSFLGSCPTATSSARHSS